MADAVIFLGWNRPTVGREQQALQVFQKSLEYYGKLQADGRIESFEPVILSAHGGDLNGFVMLRGEAEKLAEIRRDDTYIDLVTEAEYCVDGFGHVDGYIGDGLTDVISRWSKLFSE
ncbi:MAG: hypothetical protein JSW07_03330 [bacterium]|nr:MAG: hypothetical protein JSW07_03330 [bacterium]